MYTHTYTGYIYTSVKYLVTMCHVIVHDMYPLSLSKGLQGVAAGGQGTPWTSHQLIAGPSLMSNVGFSISLKDTSTCSSTLPGAGIWTSDLPIASRPALPAELQPGAEIFNMAAAWFKGVQRCICLDYNDTVNKLFQKCFTNSGSIVDSNHHRHMCTRANHCTP